MEQLTQNYLWMTDLKHKQEEHNTNIVSTLEGVASSSYDNTQDLAASAALPDFPRASAAAMLSSSAAASASIKDLTPMVEKLQALTNQELAQQTLKQVQQQVFPTNTTTTTSATTSTTTSH